MTVLEIRNLSVFFSRYYNWFRKRTEACLNGLELSVGAGQLVAVIGSSGSGKSLLAHAVMGILPRNAGWSGQMLYKGELLTPQLQQRLRGRELALVPQSVSYLNPLMQVGKQVRMSGGGVRSRTELRSMFRRYGLESQVERMYPFQLSGGMMRRVLVSTATLGGAELIIADEPTSGLHAELAQETVMRFRELADEGSAVLLITHDLESVLPYADAIAVLYGGTSIEVLLRIIFPGTAPCSDIRIAVHCGRLCRVMSSLRRKASLLSDRQEARRAVHIGNIVSPQARPAAQGKSRCAE